MYKLKLNIFGASHTKKIGFKLKGLPNGLKVNFKEIKEFLDRRKATNSVFSTKRIEADMPIFKKGIIDDKIYGEVVCEIENTNVKRGDYNELKYTPRPSHADYSAYLKYGENFDMSGGGPFSGRLTANYCIAGALANQILKEQGIRVDSYISSIGSVKGLSYKDLLVSNLENLVVPKNNFPLLDQSKQQEMEQEILNASTNLDSVGGIIETVISGNIGGLGDNFFNCLEGSIASNIFAVPSVKGIEFGAGFDIAKLNGSTANDCFYYDNGKVKTKTNNNGGINGGIANGMPICFSVAIKPTPSIAKEQDTINLQTKQNVKIQIKGRHDSCIVPRAVVVVESVTILAIADVILKEKLWKN